MSALSVSLCLAKVEKSLVLLEAFPPLCQRLLEGVLLAVLEEVSVLRSDQPLQPVLALSGSYKIFNTFTIREKVEIKTTKSAKC